ITTRHRGACVTEILLYDLEFQPFERVVPVLPVQTLERGSRGAVEPGSPERAAALDAALWTYRENSSLPHAVASGDDLDGENPVLIVTDAANPNGAQVRFFVDRAVPRAATGYERLVYLFSGHDPDAVDEARAAWRALREGHAVTYWQQDPSGRWAKKA